ncbi:Hypothetical predicted protein [Octopus vulgaris]|uniref:Uncharacterized protein n=1 Tax=Octopus vulgaris TaxID=6645 RepID=A0AA36B016_OCTVU|nr:Hypothetical predicted protein [Octopus vulgaris]
METIRNYFKKKPKDPNGIDGKYTIPEELRRQFSDYNTDSTETHRVRTISISRSGRFKPKRDRGAISQRPDIFQQPTSEKKEEVASREERKHDSPRTTRSSNNNYRVGTGTTRIRSRTNSEEQETRLVLQKTSSL